ncbi:type II toxin-antitoxin system Phd/YefM family antitoxin [Jiangella rhizosphaerae]|uniref:Type II toxin-antitoxin system prevent-host-death family antitoxin n=1 Tax=Jiangella rhizosphaerae TaxID=2293569 RepID=A0A418KVR4_9ACTN|nr:type II toxin-antitoxin system prevent-host-death family antitoxin [Jiangella rhizosphaerae]RIQ34896.1 type II toxin-antitoxin system prevent-host-death family antitoxin [Jiangella rhizosphaerae]
MTEVIGQRELRNDNAEIIRRVEAGESFVVTRRGVPVADLIPHQAGAPDSRRPTLGELQEEFRRLPPIDAARWRAERRADDEIFGPDDPLEDPWERAKRR